MTTEILKEKTTPNNCQYELGKDAVGYFVRCWNEEGELHWEVRGKVTGYVDGNPNRQITEPYTLETAEEEYAKWY